MKKKHFVTISAILFLSGVVAVAGDLNRTAGQEKWDQGGAVKKEPEATQVATFAGGCFWCVEADFEKVDGVIEVISGYTGGHEKAPTYEEVSSGRTGHAEAVQVIYDPRKVSYQDLLDVFWRHVDPTDDKGQFVDRGLQYRPAIFFHNEEQRRLAEQSRQALEDSRRFDGPIRVEIVEVGAFYPAEAYHQDYYKKNPIRYKFYRWNSGRDRFLQKAWPDRTEGGKAHTRVGYDKPDDHTIREILTPLQYNVTQKNATEPAFDNAYWNNKQPGIYVDIVSGEPLFSSLDKFDSGTGWPSFTRPLEPDNIVERPDRSLFITRTEVRSRYGDSHLGHVFSDGPPPTGLRYCINSAALRFIAKDELEKNGYGRYTALFSD